MDKKTLPSTVLQDLQMLSEEFDSLGLPEINLKQPFMKLLEDVTSNSHLLVQLHRQTICQIKDSNINNQIKDYKNHDLENKITDLQNRLKRMQERNNTLENKIITTTDECTELKKMISNHGESTSKIKLHYKSKENELSHKISNLNKENGRLKLICGEEIGKYHSRDDLILKKLSEYKNKEDNYKTTIKKLEDNNSAIVNEILDLKEELAITYLDKK